MRCAAVSASVIDGAWAPAVHRLHRPLVVASGVRPRVALITVNFSTTRHLELMLATLAEQSGLDCLDRIVIVDNGSRDGGLGFLRSLAAQASRVELVERRRFPTHAHGMRAGIAALDRLERRVEPDRRADYVLFCDSDVIWRDPEALSELVGRADNADAALAGEVRTGVNPRPDIQASFFLVRRAVLEDRSTPPPVVGGSPAYRLQRSIWDRGLGVVDFPSNQGGYILHRGRSGVAAAGQHHRLHAYARVENREPHFMGVPDGAAIWSAAEAEHAGLLGADGEPRLIGKLARAFS